MITTETELPSSQGGVSYSMNTEQRLLVVVNQLVKEREELREEVARLKKEMSEL